MESSATFRSTTEGGSFAPLAAHTFLKAFKITWTEGPLTTATDVPHDVPHGVKKDGRNNVSNCVECSSDHDVKGKSVIVIVHERRTQVKVSKGSEGNVQQERVVELRLVSV